MNTEIKTKWLAALRSGEYKQGRVWLRKHDKFCCLGVLCDLHAKETNKEWEHMPDIPELERYRYFQSSSMLPPEVQTWAQLPSDYPAFEAEQLALARLNDGGKSFTEIADLIEQRL